jgi:DNA ligase (NAD+)
LHFDFCIKKMIFNLLNQVINKRFSYSRNIKFRSFCSFHVEVNTSNKKKPTSTIQSIAKMDENSAHDELKRLNDLLNKHDKSYYHDDSSTISDDAYDKLFRRAENIVGKFNSLSSLLDKLRFNRIGFKTNTNFEAFEHTAPLLSLNNAFNNTELCKFIEKCVEKISKHYVQTETDTDTDTDTDTLPPTIEFTVEPKTDGLSLALHYREGKLIKAGTRGNGTIGENVSANALNIQGIPHNIDKKLWALLGSSDGDFEIRGEAYMSKEDFYLLNKERISNDDTSMSTARNAAAGTLRQLHPNEIEQRKLHFFGYSILTKSLINKNWVVVLDQYQILCALQDVGFHVTDPIFKVRNVDDVLNACRDIENMRRILPYETDGAVVKLNCVNNQNILGSLSRYPNWAIAFKFRNEIVETKLIGIDVHVGRTGVLTPVAKLEPVIVGGVVISSASLHNELEITRLQVKPGNIVRIKRSGDVIPKIVGLANKDEVHENSLQRKEVTSFEYVLPSKCPACGNPTSREKGGTLVRCTATMTCSAQIIQQITHFCSRDGMDIVGLGPAKIKELFNLGCLKSFADIYKLRQMDLSGSFNDNNVELMDETHSLRTQKGWGDRSVNNLLSSIDSRRNISFDRFLFALGIRHVGQETAKLISSHYINFNEFWKYVINESNNSYSKRDSVEVDLLSVPGNELLAIIGVGPKAVNSILDIAKDPASRSVIDSLLKEVHVEATPLSLLNNNNKDTVVFTGALKNMNRKTAQEMIQSKKGRTHKIGTSITKDTKLLVTNSSINSEKMKKAQEMGITIMSEEKFLMWIDENNDENEVSGYDGDRDIQ